MDLDDEAFQLALAAAFDHRLGKINSVSQRASFPLKMRHTKNYVKEGIALVGDAAHTIHPLAGQGVNLGILDSACLAEVVLNAVKKKRDFSSLPILRKYERWRKGNNLMIITAMDIFKKLFASENKTVTSIRSAGLNIANAITPAKNIIMRQAMGMSGDLPKSAI